MQKSVELMDEVIAGEEGIDYQVVPENFDDPSRPSSALLERQVRKELNLLKIEDPKRAREYEKFMFERNEYDDLIADNDSLDMSEFKVYPGSAKGPNPEDDPEHYSQWFVENQPKSIYQGEHCDFKELGVKQRFIPMVRDTTENVERKTPINYFLEEDEIYPLCNYTGQPEFSIFERDHYNVEEDEDLPSVSFSTNVGVNELPPLPSEFTLNYQEFHYELERWTVFRALPMVMKYDQAMNNFFKGVRQGTLKVPDFVNTINPPSLFAYYETLPQWARDYPPVRDVLMAFEYHKPTLDIRQKEIAMNYALSFIRPIDKEL